MSAHYCLACARDGAPGCPMTAPVVKGILDGLRPDDFGLTVTTLLACSRKEQLKQGWPYHLRPSESWWAYRGQLLCKTLGWYDSVTVRKYCFNNTSHHRAFVRNSMGSTLRPSLTDYLSTGTVIIVYSCLAPPITKGKRGKIMQT